MVLDLSARESVVKPNVDDSFPAKWRQNLEIVEIWQVDRAINISSGRNNKVSFYSDIFMVSSFQLSWFD